MFLKAVLPGNVTYCGGNSVIQHVEQVLEHCGRKSKMLLEPGVTWSGKAATDDRDRRPEISPGQSAYNGDARLSSVVVL
jgi:hypothetical protein